MLFGMKFLVNLETCAEFLDNRFREISMSLAFAAGEEELQAFAAQRFLLHDADNCVWLA
jgi:hypothetical protein